MKALYCIDGWPAEHPLDDYRNRHHRTALRTISRFMGSNWEDYCEFLYGCLVSRRTVPF